MRRLALLLATACAAGTALASPAYTDEPLDPDVAFRPDARLVAGEPAPTGGTERHGIDIDYRIAPGYYLYRSRLRFEVSPPSLLIGPPEIPRGIEVDDPFIGKSEIFRDHVTIHLPFVVSVAKAGRYKVKITAQGCAEERICFSPFPQEVVVNIPPGYRVTDTPGLSPSPKPAAAQDLPK
jgi:thioredoxin:protein disulfide reductase